MVILLTWGSLESRVRRAAGLSRRTEHSPTPRKRRSPRPKTQIRRRSEGRSRRQKWDEPSQPEAHLGPLAFKVMGLTVWHPAQ